MLPENIALVASANGLKVIHVSTDYVFDGTNYMPYTEDQAVCPASVYGKSKLAGEEALTANCKESVIIRTSWLYSSFGNNFCENDDQTRNRARCVERHLRQVERPLMLLT